jgi:hypothetical protein
MGIFRAGREASANYRLIPSFSSGLFDPTVLQNATPGPRQGLETGRKDRRLAIEAEQGDGRCRARSPDTDKIR